MILHRLTCFLLLFLLVTSARLTGGEKAKSFFSDDFSDFDFKDDDDQPLYYPPSQDSWSVEFPKSSGYNVNEDHSYENRFDDEDDWNADSHRRPSFYKRPPFGGHPTPGKRPFGEDYDSPVNSYEHHDYDNDFVQNSYHKKPLSNKNHDTYSTTTAGRPSQDGKYPAVNHDQQYNGPSYDANKQYKEKPYANKLTCYDREETCTPLNKCPISTRFDDYEAIQRCTLPDHTDGVCCPPPELPTPRGQSGNLIT